MDITSLKHKVHTAFKGAAEAVLPVRSTGGGFTDGCISPADFVTAGDFLVRTCPTWAWESGSRQLAKSYLPPDKQFLVTRNVPCYKRPAALEQAVETDTGVWAHYSVLCLRLGCRDDVPTLPGRRRLRAVLAECHLTCAFQYPHSPYPCARHLLLTQARRATSGWRRRWCGTRARSRAAARRAQVALPLARRLSQPVPPRATPEMMMCLTSRSWRWKTRRGERRRWRLLRAD